MTFVRCKRTASGTDAFYLVECVRDGKRVRQKVLAYLGECPTLEGAIAQLERWIAIKDTPSRYCGWRTETSRLRDEARQQKQRDAIVRRLENLKRLVAEGVVPTVGAAIQRAQELQEEQHRQVVEELARLEARIARAL